MYCSVVGGTVETVIVIRVQPLCLYFDVSCVLFTHLAMVHGLQGNNIHFSAAATLCQQIVPHFASQLHGTNLESLAFALATTISCWANKSMARERSD